ncbi:MAG: dTMP kinase [candidate division Zixibacteria bacterium RBG_16_40_9]|nr:MAG: dTMP kinase [candidate division Zixibacteria bacterium RBG_16_40_9]
MPGFLITLEGIDNSGKTTQAQKLSNYLSERGYKVLLVRDPGGTKISEKIRKILLDKKNRLAVSSELFLYLAARYQLVSETILPAWEKNKIVICDRYCDSTLAYQGYGRGLKVQLVDQILKSFFPIPDLTILIDIPVQISQRRFGSNEPDRLEKEKLSFHQKVRKGYLEIAKKNRSRVKVVSGAGDVEETWGKIREILDNFLSRN